jgi:hypothetical protein
MMMPTKRKTRRGGLSKPKSLTNPSQSLKLMGVNQQTRQVWLVAEVTTSTEAKKYITSEDHTEYYLMDSYNQVYLLT